VSLGHPCKVQRVSRLGSITALHSSSGRQPNFAALNRGRHLYSAGRPSRWALAYISSYIVYCFVNQGALLNAYESQSMASSSGSNPSCVLMIYGMDAARFNCQRVFNLLCVYGNIIKVSFFSEEHL